MFQKPRPISTRIMSKFYPVFGEWRNPDLETVIKFRMAKPSDLAFFTVDLIVFIHIAIRKQKFSFRTPYTGRGWRNVLHTALS